MSEQGGVQVGREKRCGLMKIEHADDGPEPEGRVLGHGHDLSVEPARWRSAVL